MERLAGRIRVVWGLRSLLLAAALAAVIGLVAYGLERLAAGAASGGSAGGAAGAGVPTSPLSPPLTAALAFAVLAPVGVAYALARYRAWGFSVGEESLVIERGVVTQVRTVVPYVRVQHVDTRRGPVERLLGLGHVVVYTAGSRGADVAIPGLTAERTDGVQSALRRLAIESEPGDGDAGDAV